MKKILILLATFLSVLGMTVAPTMVFATEIETTILTGCGDAANEGEAGEGIYCVLDMALTIATYGVGIAAVIGVIVAGIQYMTAQGNEAQMAKAKRRILEVVIGIALYALMWAILQWLIPGGVF